MLGEIQIAHDHPRSWAMVHDCTRLYMIMRDGAQLRAPSRDSLDCSGSIVIFVQYKPSHNSSCEHGACGRLSRVPTTSRPLSRDTGAQFPSMRLFSAATVSAEILNFLQEARPCVLLGRHLITADSHPVHSCADAEVVPNHRALPVPVTYELQQTLNNAVEVQAKVNGDGPSPSCGVHHYGGSGTSFHYKHHAI